MRKALFVLLRVFVKIAVTLYEAEGVNIPLMFMPTQLIAPLLREYGAEIGTHVRFRAPLTIHNAALNPEPFYRNLTVGNNCYFGRELFLDLQDQIVIEGNVTVSMRVMILTHTDVGESPLKNTVLPSSQAPVVIRRGAYIGAGAIILQGVEIGECATVAAGTVVTRNVPAHSVVAGVPARVIRISEEVEPHD